MYIWGVIYYLNGLGVIVYLVNVKFIGVWVWGNRFYLFDYDIVELIGDWFEIVYFQIGYGDLVY